MGWAVPRVIRGNRGDIASRYGILGGLADRGVPVTALFAARSDHVPPQLGTEILPYGPAHNLWPGWRGVKALARSRAVIWTGGLDLQDDSSLLKLLHTWLVFLSYRLLGLKILLAHQGAGPLTTCTGRWLARRVLGCVDLALVRDRGSCRVLADLVPAERLRLGADGIFLDGFPTRDQPGLVSPAIMALRDTGGRPLVGLNVRLWFHFAASWIPYQFARERYRQRAQAPIAQLLDSLAQAVAHLRRRHRARVVLVSMYEPGVEPWEDDLPLLASLKERFGGDDEVVLHTADVPIGDLCRLFGRLDLMIGMRLHATLIALRAGVPAIHIAYTLKGHDIYADLGLSEWLVSVEEARRSPDGIVRLIDAVLGDPARFDRVAAIVRPLVARNMAALAEAVNVVERG